MSTPQSRPRPLRLLPGIIIVTLQWIIRYVVPILIPESPVLMAGVMVGLLGGVAVLVWWVFFSRAPLIDRLGGVVLMIGALIGTSFLLDVSIATANMGLMFMMYSIPVMSLAFVAGTVATARLAVVPRRMTMIVIILFASGMWLFLRTDGMNGSARHEFAWRWARTHESRMLAQPVDKPLDTPKTATVDSSAQWPGFRGPGRDGILHGVRIKTDWTAFPPKLLWRKAVGPGCSSFAIRGDLLYTQEQRGDDEMVSCYNLTTGTPVWQHTDKARFYDSHAGAGPRSTPTLAGGRVYTLGGTGILNALDAGDGSAKWSRDAASDAGVKVLRWGFSSSPLVVNGLVIIALSGKLAAYDTADGEPRWFGPDGGASYSSPQLFAIDGVPQVILMSTAGAVSVEPDNGREIWKHGWVMEDRILQPALIPPSDLLLSADGERSLRHVTVSHGNGVWGITELWTSEEMKLNFNDMVIHKGYAYGFDGSAIACIDINNGKRMWKGNRYRGWIILLADQDVLLVLSEKGELALVRAVPDAFTELSRIPAIQGKTWNHPAMSGNIVVVRNAQEMAVFRLVADDTRDDVVLNP